MAPDWLTARPIAHRGLHNAAAAIIENTPGAANAAIGRNYAIECDVQISADGEAMVFHDDELNRLTEGNGAVRLLAAADLKRIAFKHTTDRMVTLAEYCELIAGRVPLIVEIKSRFERDRNLADRVAAVLKSYRGPAAVMSFDPFPVAAIRHNAPKLIRGIVAERHYDHPEWRFLSAQAKRSLAWLQHAYNSRPQFLAWYVNDLPGLVPALGRNLFGLPLLTWTVRTDAQRAIADRYADQMIFEGFLA